MDLGRLPYLLTALLIITVSKLCSSLAEMFCAQRTTTMRKIVSPSHNEDLAVIEVTASRIPVPLCINTEYKYLQRTRWKEARSINFLRYNVHQNARVEREKMFSAWSTPLNYKHGMDITVGKKIYIPAFSVSMHKYGKGRNYLTQFRVSNSKFLISLQRKLLRIEKKLQTELWFCRRIELIYYGIFISDEHKLR